MSERKDSATRDSQAYREKKARFDNMLTIFGRKPVLEALRDSSVPVHKLHLADSNQRGSSIIGEIESLAQQRDITINYLSKRELSRISRNSKQDQGVAADLLLTQYQQFNSFITEYTPRAKQCFIALDRVTNPQNLGMIIRSAAAAGVDGLLIPNKGCAAINALVIKASAGAVFHCPIIRCDQLNTAIDALRQSGVITTGLMADGEMNLGELQQRYAAHSILYVLGNETEGVSNNVRACLDHEVNIPM